MKLQARDGGLNRVYNNPAARRRAGAAGQAVPVKRSLSGLCRVWNDPKSVLRARAAVNTLLRMPPSASPRRIQKLKKARRSQSEW